MLTLSFQNLKGYDEKSDIYSIGVVCCELGNGAVPFAEIPSTLMLTEKVRGSRPQLLDCSTFPQPCLDDAEMKSKQHAFVLKSSTLEKLTFKFHF